MNPRDLLFAISMLLVLIGMARTGAAFADQRGCLTCAEFEVSLIGKGVLWKNLASGTLPQWEFRRDGSVAASRSGWSAQPAQASARCANSSRSICAAATIARSLPMAESRGKYFMPQSGARITFSGEM